MDDLIARVGNLERDVGEMKQYLVRMEGRFDTIDAKLDTIATKAELYQTLNAQTWKIIGLMGVMTALFTAIVKWL